MHISLCCIPWVNTILFVSYISVEKKKGAMGAFFFVLTCKNLQETLLFEKHDEKNKCTTICGFKERENIHVFLLLMHLISL